MSVRMVYRYASAFFSISIVELFVALQKWVSRVDIFLSISAIAALFMLLIASVHSFQKKPCKEARLSAAGSVIALLALLVLSESKFIASGAASIICAIAGSALIMVGKSR